MNYTGSGMQGAPGETAEAGAEGGFRDFAPGRRNHFVHAHTSASASSLESINRAVHSTPDWLEPENPVAECGWILSDRLRKMKGWAGDVAQLAENLPSVWKALGSVPSRAQHPAWP